MPRYFFDVINGHGLERDEDGKELSNRDDIPEYVASVLSDITRAELPNTAVGAVKVSVRDARNTIIFRGALNFQGEWS